MNREFQSHRLNTEGFDKAVRISAAFDSLVTFLETVCAPGREMAIARTKLEEACFFAKKAMAVQPENQEQDVR